MLRLVRSPSAEVIPDPARRLPGRGVYLCYSLACIEQAVKKNQFQRGFRASISDVVTAKLVAMIKSQLLEQLRGHIAMSRKAGLLLAGASQLQERIGREPLSLLVLAKDISKGRADKLCAKALSFNIETVRHLDKATLGQLVGKGESSALGLRPGGLAESFRKSLLRYRQLSGEH